MIRKKRKNEEQVLNMEFVSEANRKMKLLKNQWKLFSSNKEWILSLLFVSSVVHAVLLYGLFGINILEFYSLTDFFVNFAEVFVPFIILIPLCLFLYLLPEGKTKCKVYIIFFTKLVVLCFLSIIISQIFDLYLGGLFIIYTISLSIILEKESHSALAWYFLSLFILVAIVHPIEIRMMYKNNTKLIDRLSFDYMERTYNMSDIDSYFYIGGSSDYFFVYNKSADSVEVIPKDECNKISRKPFYWEDLWKSETYINSTQKKRSRRFRNNE